MKVINKQYLADEASLRIDAYLDLLGEDKTINYLNSVPIFDESTEPAVAIRVTIVCVEFSFYPKDDSEENRQWNQMVGTQAFVNEMLMVMMDSSYCQDVTVVGTYIFGVFSTPFKTQIDELLETLAKINSVSDLVAKKLNEKGIKAPKVRIGADYGSVLHTSCRLSEETNEYFWNGTRFKHLADLVDQQMNEEEVIVVTEIFWQNVKDDYKKYLIAKDGKYVANVKNVVLKKWMEEHE